MVGPGRLGADPGAVGKDGGGALAIRYLPETTQRKR